MQGGTAGTGRAGFCLPGQGGRSQALAATARPSSPLTPRPCPWPSCCSLPWGVSRRTFWASCRRLCDCSSCAACSWGARPPPAAARGPVVCFPLLLDRFPLWPDLLHCPDLTLTFYLPTLKLRRAARLARRCNALSALRRGGAGSNWGPPGPCRAHDTFPARSGTEPQLEEPGGCHCSAVGAQHTVERANCRLAGPAVHSWSHSGAVKRARRPAGEHGGGATTLRLGVARAGPAAQAPPPQHAPSLPACSRHTAGPPRRPSDMRLHSRSRASFCRAPRALGQCSSAPEGLRKCCNRSAPRLLQA